MASTTRWLYRLQCTLIVLLLAATHACSDGAQQNDETHALERDAGCAGKCADGRTAPLPSGLIQEDGGWTLRTESIELEPSEERFVCYAATLPEQLAIRRFSSTSNPIVHHFLLVQALSAEPEGLSECDVLFKLTWAPMYPATTADSEIVLPEGSAKILEKDTQILLQMHLLNPTTEKVRSQIEVRLDDAVVPDPTPVGITLFGDANFRLPPLQQTAAEHTCTLENDVSLYALLPHMHYLGRRLELEVETDSGFETIYSRDDFDFDNQYVDPVDMELEAGTRVRTRCVFDNDTDSEVSFGENSESEMCVAVGFRVGEGEEFQICSDVPEEVNVGVPHDPSSGVCGEMETSEGLGRRCTLGGGECPEDLFCAADLLGLPEGFCFRVGCHSSNECNDSKCCTLPVLGDFANVCVPEYCRPDFCVPIENQSMN